MFNKPRAIGIIVATLALISCTPDNQTALTGPSPSPTHSDQQPPTTSHTPLDTQSPSPSPICAPVEVVAYVSHLSSLVDSLLQGFEHLGSPYLYPPEQELPQLEEDAALVAGLAHPRCASPLHSAASDLGATVLALGDHISTGLTTFDEAESELLPLISRYVSQASDLRSLVDGSDSPAIEPLTTRELRGNGHRSAECAAFAPDAGILALGGYRGLDLWKPSSAEKIAYLPIEGHCIQSAFSPGSQYILFAPFYGNPYADYPLLIWDMSRMELARAIDPRYTEAGAATFDSDSPDIAVAWTPESVSIYRLEDLPYLSQGVLPPEGRNPPPRLEVRLDRPFFPSAIAYSSRAHLLAATDWDGTLATADPSQASALHTFRSPPTVYEPDLFRPRPSVAVSPTGDFVAWGARGFQLSLWETTDAAPSPLGGPLLETYSLVFSDTGASLLSGGLGEAVVWDVASRSATCRLRAGSNPIIAVSFGPDSRTAYAASDQSQLFTWDLPPECTP